MDIKTKGIEFKVHDNDGKFRGDCYLTKTNLIWCEGKKPRKNGKKITWNKFIKSMNS